MSSSLHRNHACSSLELGHACSLMHPQAASINLEQPHATSLNVVSGQILGANLCLTSAQDADGDRAGGGGRQVSVHVGSSRVPQTREKHGTASKNMLLLEPPAEQCRSFCASPVSLGESLESWSPVLESRAWCALGAAGLGIPFASQGEALIFMVNYKVRPVSWEIRS